MEVTVSIDKAFNGIIFSKVRIIISFNFTNFSENLLHVVVAISRNFKKFKIIREIAARYSKKTVGLRYIPSKF